MSDLVLVLLGAVAATVLLALLARENPGGGRTVPGLVRPVPQPLPTPRPVGLLAWEADLLAAVTGDGRSRRRLARRLKPLVAALLLERHGVEITDPRATAILGPDWEALVAEDPPGRAETASVTGAEVVGLVDRLLDRLEADDGAAALADADADGGVAR